MFTRKDLRELLTPAERAALKGRLDGIEAAQAVKKLERGLQRAKMQKSDAIQAVNAWYLAEAAAEAARQAELDSEPA